MSSVPAIQVENLSMRFGGHLALDSLNFSLPDGAFLAVLGPNGAGKSTLLKTLLGVLEPTAGSVHVFGRPPREMPPEKIGYVPQIKTLDRTFPAVPLELVLTGIARRWPARIRADDRQKALLAMERTGTAHLATRSIGHLSGGELQRVYLARGLVREPRLILLDEPATGMDVAGEADMYVSLESYQHQTHATVFMITHDWQVAKHHADHVLVMDRHLVGFGAPSEALGDDVLMRAFGHLGHTHPYRKSGDGGESGGASAKASTSADPAASSVDLHKHPEGGHAHHD